MLTNEEIDAVKNALSAVLTLKFQAEDRGNSHDWDKTIETLKHALARNGVFVK